MATEADGWTVLDEQSAILTRTYSFAPKAWARTLVARFAPRELLVMSPPSGLDDAAYKGLERFGRVTALVAPNGFHYLGLGRWKEVYPEAGLFASEKAMARIRKKQPALTSLEPLSDLSKRLAPELALHDLPFFKIGEAWLSAKSKRGPIWYVSDSFFSMPTLPDSFFMGLLFKWTGSAPGFRVNGLGNKVFLSDKRGYKAWALDRLKAEEPSTVVTAHGDVVQQPNLRQTMMEMIERNV